MIRKLISGLFILVFASLPASAGLFGDKAEKKKQEIQEMRQEVLSELYSSRPQAKTEIKKAKGYAVFSNIGVNVVLFSAGGGRGVVHDNRSGGDTYMKMASGGVGIGLGIKDFRAVFVFHDAGALDDFINKGWDFSGQADAAAQVDDHGGELSEASTISKKVSVYQFTENGLALQATLQGTKYWKDKKLNK